jgi:hypothetical protein
VEVPAAGWDGGPATRTVTGGVKLALFDVSDPQRPAEAWTATLGGPGSWSPASRDPHAFLFHPRSGVLAVPVALAAERYRAAFDGLVVLRLAGRGFRAEGNVSHHAGAPPARAGWGGGPRSIYRAVYMDGTLWSVSERVLAAHRLVGAAGPPEPLAELNATVQACLNLTAHGAGWWPGYFPGGVAVEPPLSSGPGGSTKPAP